MSVDTIPGGQLAAVVTYLEMHRPPKKPIPDSPLSLRRIERPGLDRYRDLFRLVGSPWLWFSRLVMEDSKLESILDDPAVELFTVTDGASADLGMIELDFRKAGECELAFVGLIATLAGNGHGRWLLAEALSLAWRDGVAKVHVHTCTLDHPAALPAYHRAGFEAVSRSVERFPDPRLVGILPPDCAPQLPLLGTVTELVTPAES